ncbi:DUF2199 domain-containing protein [Inhella proteolytica]|uniref:DUF2199 domain-containing protein n=1 Tax=Inhella proteolytica TaxID=2795029 RepID=A0A931J265_9BURK|nr:DUF2199 domain-containing protein [Inhella proteolytica]MBH9578151.1 DUF2199 domain-containing protein [Inhella proteolytica]
MSSTYTCAHCGQEHDGLPTDWGFKLPDEVHALSYPERYARTRHCADLCTLDESRWFIRALLPIPLQEGEPDEVFNWGVWIEVDKATHDLYVTSWEEDIADRPRASGQIANDLKVYGGTLGLPVEIEFRSGTERPLAWCPVDTVNAVALEQRGGISSRRHHDILTAVGYFDDEVAA